MPLSLIVRAGGVEWAANAFFAAMVFDEDGLEPGGSGGFAWGEGLGD